MIRLHGLTKHFGPQDAATHVARGISAVFERGTTTGLLGHNGAGKSTLLKIIAGSAAADAGHVEVDGLISWPIGFSGSFHGDLTGAQNTRFLARVYGTD
ncbi:MAG: ATP-binding cassette domain-containing protein, partial [Pseudomonadota bacterium]